MPANWFIALPVAAPLSHGAARFDAADWLATLPAAPPAVRLFTPADLHITVAFLGPVAEERARAAFALARSFPLSPLDVRLAQVVPLGARRRPSAYSALLGQGREQVEQAMGQARDALADQAGAQREQRPPLAHVTLARPERAATLQQVADGLAWARSLQLPTSPLRITRIALYTRSADRSQRLFTIVAEHDLCVGLPDSEAGG